MSKMWYAVMMDNDDQDWGTGSYDKSDAIKLCREYRADYPDAYIAVIEEGAVPVCIDVIKEV